MAKHSLIISQIVSQLCTFDLLSLFVSVSFKNSFGESLLFYAVISKDNLKDQGPAFLQESSAGWKRAKGRQVAEVTWEILFSILNDMSDDHSYNINIGIKSKSQITPYLDTTNLSILMSTYIYPNTMKDGYYKYLLSCSSKTQLCHSRGSCTALFSNRLYGEERKYALLKNKATQEWELPVFDMGVMNIRRIESWCRENLYAVCSQYDYLFHLDQKNAVELYKQAMSFQVFNVCGDFRENAWWDQCKMIPRKSLPKPLSRLLSVRGIE